MPELRLTQSSNGSTVSVRTGDAIRVELPEIPTTGYRWTLALHDDILRPTGDDFQISSSQGIGGGGIRIFHFTARHPGDTNLRLTLVRPWQQNSPSETFSIQVHVLAQPH